MDQTGPMVASPPQANQVHRGAPYQFHGQVPQHTPNNVPGPTVFAPQQNANQWSHVVPPRLLGLPPATSSTDGTAFPPHAPTGQDFQEYPVKPFRKSDFQISSSIPGSAATSPSPGMYATNETSVQPPNPSSPLPPKQGLRPQTSTLQSLNPSSSSHEHIQAEAFKHSLYSTGRPETVALHHMGNGYNQVPARPLGDLNSFNRSKQRKFQNLSRYMRIIRIVSNGASAVFSAIIFAMMAQVTIKYYSTENLVLHGRRAWPESPKVWPMIMLFVGSSLTLAMAIVLTFAYCCCFNRAQKSWKLTLTRYAIHIITWIIISFIYRYEKSLNNINNDLWGWSCAEKAGQLQADLEGRVNFTSLCNIQSSSWHFSIIEAVVKVVFAVIHFILYRKTRDGEKRNFANSVGGVASDLVSSYA